MPNEEEQWRPSEADGSNYTDKSHLAQGTVADDYYLHMESEI